MNTYHLISLFALISYAETKELMDYLYVDRIECTYNRDICGTPTCKSKFYNRTSKLATVSCFAIVPYVTIKVKSSLHYRFTGGYRQFAINIESDWCKFMDGTDKSVLLDVFLKYIKGHTNFDRKCPYTGNISVSDLPLDAQVFGGQLLPAGDYYYQTLINANGVHCVTVKVFFNIPHGKTIFDDAMG